MTLRSKTTRRLVGVAVTVLAWTCGGDRVAAEIRLAQAISVNAVIASRVKVVFDRTAVAFDTLAYDPDSIVPIQATPLTVTAKARVSPHTRVIMTLRADGPLTSGTDTIPANQISWTMTGDGFQNGGTANPNAARTIGSWRGSGSWTGTQIYQFTDSWSYNVGLYTLTMTYTVSAP